MSCVDVVLGEVRAASGQVRAVAEVISGADPDVAAELVNSAIPASTSAEAAVTLAAAWRVWLKRWEQYARAYSEALLRCADEFESTDESAAASLNTVGARM